MKGLKKGMYIRCPVDEEYPELPRRFALGQVASIDYDLNKARVKFYDFDNIMNYYSNIKSSKEYYIDQLQRSKIIPGTSVNYLFWKGRIITYSHKNREGYYVYYVELLDGGSKTVEKISEDKLHVQFTQAESNPIKQLLTYELHNPRWYIRRRIVSKLMNIVKNSSYGFEFLVGSRVYLLPHQVETVVRVLSEDKCRFMLADEVGLGKTIQACAILKGLKNRTEIFNTLLLIPSSLAAQWKNELYYKFNIDVDIWRPGKPIGTDVIVPMDLLETAVSKGILEYGWDLCIVDETHHLLKNSKHYMIVEDISKNIDHILLLSATPVLERRAEYLNLLRLLKPHIYNNMSMEEFKLLVKRQACIQEIVYSMVRDLDYYIEDELYEDFHDDLRDLEDILEDDLFSKLVDEIDFNSEDYGIQGVKLCLAYISQHYQIEKNIIRHRRQILKEEMAKRVLEYYPYEMAGAETSFYEGTVYEEVKELIRLLLKLGDLKENKIVIRELLGGMFSSPWALLDATEKLINKLSNGLITYNDQIKESISKILSLTELWAGAVLEEFENFEELYDYPERIQGRLLYVLDYLQQQLDDTKIVIFTQFTSTLVRFEKLMERCFGPQAFASFYKGLDDETLNANADRFQNDENCRFMLCDELGGEGRNFQIADQIVHVDLPWSANELEQRIGRLDRLGRDPDKDILSVVFYAKDTIEEDLFNIWKDGLGVFENSLSGLEIVLGELNDLILESLCKDLDYGLADAVDAIVEKAKEMKRHIEHEEYYDIASQLDRDTEDMLYKLIESFTENSGEQLYRSMMAWASMAGLKAVKNNSNGDIIIFNKGNFNYKSAQHTMLIPPKWKGYYDYLIKRKTYDIRGTFNRDLAIKREGLLFFAPGDPVYDCITSNALSCDLGKSTAFAVEGDFYFKGFIFTWLVEPNISYLLELGEDLIHLSKFRGYLPLEQIVSVIPIDEESQRLELYEHKVIALLDKLYDSRKFVHLGKRGPGGKKIDNIPANISNFEWFRSEYPDDIWNELIVKSFNKSKEEVKERLKYEINIKGAKNELERMIYANKACQIYFNKDKYEKSRIEKIYEEILRGLKSPICILDSAAFIMVVKSHA